MRTGSPTTELRVERADQVAAGKTGWWRQLAEQSRDGIVVLDRTGRVFWSNGTFAAMLGRKREEMRRLSVSDWDASAPPDRIQAMLEAVDEVGDHFETVHTRTDGTTYDVEICTNAVTFHDRKLVLCVCRDISGRKQGERRLQQLLDETRSLADKLAQQQDVLVQAENLASIGRLAAGVAHEINNPLAIILGNLNSLTQYMAGLDEAAMTVANLADLAANGGSSDEIASVAARLGAAVREARTDFSMLDALAMLADLIDGVERIRTIVNHLHVFADMDEAGCGDVAVSDVVNAAVVATHGNRGPECQVVVDVADDLPVVRWYRRTMERALTNLLNNAAQAVRDGGTVRVSARALDAGRVVIVVSDNGVGIPAEHLRRVFDPFFTTRDVGKGTGLGLHVAHACVERHGGKIAVESRVGAGTSFTIMLPVCAPDEAAAPRD